MKKNPIQSYLAAATSIFAFFPLCVSLAADTNTATGTDPAQATPTPAPVISATPVKLPYGAQDVLKLSRAQIGDEVILNYVRSSGTIYNLAPKDIVYLKEQGVSEKVISAMLDQRKRAEFAAQTVAPAPSVVPNAQTVAPAQNVPDAAMVPAAPTDPNVAYAEAPLTPPASSVYVVPYPAASYAYYGSYGYYPYYYGGWYGPSVSLGFRFGGHGGYHGGYRGHGSFGGHGGGGHHR